MQNVGVLDSVVRIAIGFGLLFVAFIVPPPLKWAAWAGFLIFTVTGLAGKCLLYRLFGINTCAE